MKPIQLCILKYCILAGMLFYFTISILKAQEVSPKIHFRASKDTTVWGKPILVVAEDDNGNALYYAMNGDTLFPKTPLSKNEVHSLPDVNNKMIIIKDYEVHFKLFNQDERLNSPYPLPVADEYVSELKEDTGKFVSGLLIHALLLDTSFNGVPKISYHKEAQIDDDSEKELIVLLDYNNGFKEIIILDKLNDKYFLVSNTRHHTRWVKNLFPEPDTINKIICFPEEIYGTGRSGISLVFYKLIQGKLYECLRIDEAHYAHCMGYGALENTFSSKYKFIDPKNIQVSILYNLWSSVYANSESNEEIGRVSILKKKAKYIYTWDEASKTFVNHLPIGWKFPKNVNGGPDDFFIFYLPEIKALALKGNKKQLKALHFF